MSRHTVFDSERLTIGADIAHAVVRNLLPIAFEFERQTVFIENERTDAAALVAVRHAVNGHPATAKPRQGGSELRERSAEGDRNREGHKHTEAAKDEGGIVESTGEFGSGSICAKVGDDGRDRGGCAPHDPVAPLGAGPEGDDGRTTQGNEEYPEPKQDAEHGTIGYDG
ncbi:MAG: hypothetical protein ACOC1F_00780 [Myxococcota bacterium]